MRKPERTVNLVFVDNAYQIVEDSDLRMMKMKRQVVFEKGCQQGNLFGFFYRKVD